MLITLLANLRLQDKRTRAPSPTRTSSVSFSHLSFKELCHGILSHFFDDLNCG